VYRRGMPRSPHQWRQRQAGDRRLAGLKATQLARRADLALAVSLVVVLQLANLVAVPLWAGQVVSGASISATSILGNLLLLVLIPLAVGLVVRARYAEHAATWQVELGKVSNLALAIALIAGIAVNWSAIVSLLGSWVLVASALTAIVSVVLGGLVGRADTETRTTTGLVSGLRFRVAGSDHHRHPAQWKRRLPRPGHRLLARRPHPRPIPERRDRAPRRVSTIRRLGSTQRPVASGPAWDEPAPLERSSAAGAIEFPCGSVMREARSLGCRGRAGWPSRGC
jgi:hypothetical protein